MLDLVLWTWLLALAPWALGLARKVISGVAGRIGPAAPTVRSPFPGGQASPRPSSRPGRGSVGNSHAIQY